MKGKRSSGLLALLLFWLVGGAFIAEAGDLSHFQALNLIRLSRAPTVPDLSLLDLKEQEVPLRSFRGKVVLLNFWTTW